MMGVNKVNPTLNLGKHINCSIVQLCQIASSIGSTYWYCCDYNLQMNIMHNKIRALKVVTHLSHKTHALHLLVPSQGQ